MWVLNWGVRGFGNAPHKQGYISSVDGRGATGIKKPLSAPLLWQPGHGHDMSASICSKARWCTRCGLMRERAVSWRYTQTESLDGIWVASSRCGQCVVSAGILTKCRQKTGASEERKKDPVILLIACRCVLRVRDVLDIWINIENNVKCSTVLTNHSTDLTNILIISYKN